MKITQGFVAVKPDGTFVHVSVRSTHTGHHVELEDAKTIEEASFLSHQGFGDYDMAPYQRQRFKEGVTFVPVEVRREVILKGYGHVSA